jgi:hypothetical protein
MPIVFVHGVNVRSTADFGGIETLLRATVAPLLVAGTARTASSVPIKFCYWGDLGVKFAWNLASLPANSTAGIAAMGPIGADLSDKLLPLAGSLNSLELGEILSRQPNPQGPQDPGIIAMGAWQAPTTFFGADPDSTSSLIITMMASQDPKVVDAEGGVQSVPTDFAQASLAIDQAAREIVPSVQPSESATETLNRINIRAKEILAAAILAQGPGIVPMGVIGDVIDHATNAVRQLVDYANDSTGEAIAHALIGIRRPLSQFLATFFGDIFVYLQSRDADPVAPSPILKEVLDTIKAARDLQKDEPLVILTHSMGGQIVYDIVTWYCDHLPEFSDIEIAFWGAAACQVGLFEEMKLFKASSPAYKAPGRVPAPSAMRLKKWYGYWDPSDIFSFLTAPMIDGVTDQVFTSGTTPLQAHGQYLIQPRFYRMLASDVAAALKP